MTVDMVGYRDSLWPGSFSHTVAWEEEECASQVETPRLAEERGFMSIIRAGFSAARGFDQLCILFLFWQVHAKCHSAVIPVGININSEINSSNL